MQRYGAIGGETLQAVTKAFAASPIPSPKSAPLCVNITGLLPFCPFELLKPLGFLWEVHRLMGVKQESKSLEKKGKRERLYRIIQPRLGTRQYYVTWEQNIKKRRSIPESLVD